MPHEHSVIDTDTHFIIDGRTKVISFAGDNLPVIVQYDHNSERMTFELPRSIEGHDMTACNKVEVHYINIDKNTKQQKAGAYEVSDMTAPEDSADTVSFSWLNSNQATQLIGPLSFLVKFKCVAEDGTVEYEWNTAKFTGLAVQDGINNTEVIAEEYADILAAWDGRIAALEQNPSGVQTINGVAPDDEGNVMLDMPEQVQSDLSVNDESDPAFVKGRTHYVTKTLETVLPETTYETYGKYPYGDGYYWSQSTWSAVHTYTFRVTFDGVVYDNLVSPDDSSLGNLSFENGSYEDNGLPFLVTVGSMGSMYIVSKTEGTHTIKAEKYVIEYVKLDSNYLSDNVVLNGKGATGYNAIALGGAQKASGFASFAEGYNTSATNYHAHAEGSSTVASGQYGSHAEGTNTTASGSDGSHAEGKYTLASSASQHAQGKYNIEDKASTYAHIVGNGTSTSKRSNAHTLDWSGNAWFAGTVEGTGIILKSSTADSTKRFLVTVDDSGTLAATEITE